MQDDIQINSQIFTFPKVAGLYNIGKTIGKGHFAVVKEACHVITQEKVAIKIIDKTKLDQSSKDQLLSEVMCMKLVQHPNVIRLYEVIDTVTKLYLIVELGDGGDLYDYITSKASSGLCEDEAKRYFRQILRAIGYCHKLHVVHRDIKPENLVFFKQLEVVKLTDFGFSNKFVPGGTLSTSCGSLAYSAPEILLGDSYDAPMVDIWSLGVILFMLVVGSLPFNETNDSETISKIMDCKYAVPSFVSDGCRQLIGKMLVREAKNRATLDDINRHNWLQIDVNDAEYELDSYSIPLITREQLTFEEHMEIVSKMSDENLATVEEIQRFLDTDAYNYISATYFLLAERKVKRRFVEEYVKLKTQLFTEKPDEIVSQNLETQKSVANALLGFEATRRISMILEDDEEEENAAITSLAFVRRELDSFVSDNGGNSRCLSRINSASDLHSLFDEYELESRLKLCNPISTRQRSSTANNIVSTKKSLSVTDLTENNTLLENRKSFVHMFSVGPNTTRSSISSNKIEDFRKISLLERPSNQIFFDTGSNSTTANCSSPEISDSESESKSKKKNSSKNIEKQKSEFWDFREIFGPINEEDEFNKSRDVTSPSAFSADYYRSQSFDGRLRNNVQLDCTSARAQLPLTWNHKSPTNSWHRNSLCHHLADSNFSLASWASKTDNPNMMQVIRGTIGLHLHNRSSIVEGGLQPTKDQLVIKMADSSSSLTKSCSTKHSSVRPRNIYKYFRTALPKLRKGNHCKAPCLDRNTCHSSSPVKHKQASSSNDYDKCTINKSDDLFIKTKTTHTCCRIS